MDIPSLQLIAPGALLDAAACARVRDAIAAECAALRRRMDEDKESSLADLEQQAQQQLDQMQTDIEREQFEVQTRKLAEQEAIFAKQLKVSLSSPFE
jgi:hypothetical protein